MRFPGMNPYLEDPNLWPGFHHLLADEIVAQLNSHIGPKYFADVEVRTVLEDVAIGTTRSMVPDAAVVTATALRKPQGSTQAATIEVVKAPILRQAVLPEPFTAISSRTITAPSAMPPTRPNDNGNWS